jgi:hypothetical protein
VLEDGAGVKERLKVEDVVVGGGRLPHGFLHSKTRGAAARTPGRRCTRSLKPPWTRSGARWPAPRR